MGPGRERSAKMPGTDVFFLIHNFHTVPEKLLSYASDYALFDATDDDGGQTRRALEQAGIAWQPVHNTGHNITTYFQWFADNYEKLPEVTALLKGNILGRHCSEEYFARVCKNSWFTYLYEDKAARQQFAKNGLDTAAGTAFYATESQFVEVNNSWYASSENHPHRYFDNYDDLFRFIYKDPVVPRYYLFSPGACYILRREQIQLHGPAFYRNLNKIMDYGIAPHFSSEAHQIERMLPVIFEMRYEVNPWMEDEGLFDQELEKRRQIMETKEAARAAAAENLSFKRLRRLLRPLKKFLKR